ncbi:hypothetical protein [Lacunimicrobium album]
MSSIGPMGFLPIALAGNAAANATQQKEHQQVRDAVVAKNFERELKQKAEQTKNDVSDLDLSEDRDADGRLLAQDEGEMKREDEQAEEKSAVGRSTDPDGEVGMKLDLEA